MPYALKSIRKDGTTKNSFQWPDKGLVEEISNINPDNKSSCPRHIGDGICLGKTFYGMSQGGIPANFLLTVRYQKEDVLGEDNHKLRVKRCTVLRRWTIKEWIKAHSGFHNFFLANLWGADLQKADLQGADLRGANLREANLREANLWGSNLRGANLREANLRGADFRGANLQRAYLQGADFRGANLRGIDLRHTSHGPSKPVA